MYEHVSTSFKDFIYVSALLFPQEGENTAVGLCNLRGNALP